MEILSLVRGSTSWWSSALVVVVSDVTLLAASVVVPVALGNDGAIVNVGGGVRLMDEHPSVHLYSEFVHAWVSNDEVKVECVFFLWNDGPATTVTIGFPNNSYGADVEGSRPFRSFRSFVNGDSTAVVPMPDVDYQSYGDYRTWMVKTVEFAEQEVKCIRNEYTSSPGHDASTPPNYFFEYILLTGGHWAGPIEVAEIVVTLEDIPPDAVQHISPSWYDRSGNEIRWHYGGPKDETRPTMEDIHVRWQ